MHRKVNILAATCLSLLILSACGKDIVGNKETDGTSGAVDAGTVSSGETPTEPPASDITSGEMTDVTGGPSDETTREPETVGVTGDETDAPTEEPTDTTNEPSTDPPTETVTDRVTDPPETTRPPETTKPKPETTRPPETTKPKPETTRPPETTKPKPETTRPPETTKPKPETTKPPETTRAPETTKAPDPPKEPVTPTYPKVSAPGTAEKRNDKAVIDYSNASDGYVMVKFTADTSKRLKVLINGPATQYNYDLKPGVWVAFPFSEGNGDYKIGVYENVKDSSYATVLSETVKVNLKDEFAPFLRSNQYVDYEAAPNAINKAWELCGSSNSTLEKIDAIYEYVVTSLTYDKEKAKTVTSGYLPVLDDVMAKKKGICFDYAALMTGMLRCTGVPCKLVVGYAGNAYHAWISVWSSETGWIDNVIYFDGKTWQRMDPTFASSGNRSKAIMEYIGDGTNYVSKYFY